MFDVFPPPPPFRHWMRHIAAVPKGFLRYQVLELLSEKPMSGSEIISEIERRTGGWWKPSPGSVYPLLAWLQDNGYVREVPTEETGVRRYGLTDKGKQLLEEQRKVRHHFPMGRKFFALPMMGGLWLRIPQDRAEEIRESFRHFLKALFSLGLTLEERFSEQALKEALTVLNETTKRLENLEKRLKGEKT
ncbi:MAG: PadR family transcriptional regulator [Candidatus Bathyarchaeota archaeon]|nr:PadR family transcriptional regulator [Candidatus Bathyarchaeota archaeon]